MTSAQIIDFELRERVRELTERLEPTNRAVPAQKRRPYDRLRGRVGHPDLLLLQVLRTVVPAGDVLCRRGR